MFGLYGDAPATIVAGRILIAGFFFVAFCLNVTPFGIKDHVTRLRAARTPLPAAAFWFGILLQFCGSVMILLDFRPEIGAVLLIVFTIFASLFLMRFWDLPKDHPMRRIMRNGMMGNAAIVGGLLLLLDTLR
jgi:uncharacterized membrane protein YphA (DoxX/SURF4 family)